MPKASCHEQHEIQQHDSYCISICLVHRGSRNVQTFVFHLSQPCPLAGWSWTAPWIAAGAAVSSLASTYAGVPRAEQCPPPRTSAHGTGSTAADVDARRQEQAVPCPPPPGRRSLPRQQARRVVALGSAFASCCRCNRDRWTAAVSGDMAALRRRDARGGRRRGGTSARGGRYFIYRPPLGHCRPSDCTLTWSFSSCLARRIA